jgi:hypothetical protein
MSGRVSKRSRHPQTVRADALYRSILQSGVATMPCTFCFNNNLSCVVQQGSLRCAECTRSKRSCDGVDIVAPCELLASVSWRCLFLTIPVLNNLEEQRRLEAAEEETEEQLAALNAKLARIRRQKRLARQRGSQLFARGAQEEDRDVQAAHHSPNAGQSEPAVQPPLDWSSIDWSSLGTLDSAGGNPGVLSGSSPSA